MAKNKQRGGWGGAQPPPICKHTTRTTGFNKIHMLCSTLARLKKKSGGLGGTAPPICKHTARTTGFNKILLFCSTFARLKINSGGLGGAQPPPFANTMLVRWVSTRGSGGVGGSAAPPFKHTARMTGFNKIHMFCSTPAWLTHLLVCPGCVLLPRQGACFLLCRPGAFFFLLWRPGAFFFLLRRRGLTHSLVGLPWLRTPPSPGRVFFFAVEAGRVFFLLWRPGAFFFAVEARAHSLTCWSALAAYSSLARARFLFCCGGRARFFFCCGGRARFFFAVDARGSLTHLLVCPGCVLLPRQGAFFFAVEAGRVFFFAVEAGRVFFFCCGGRARFFLLWRAAAGFGSP